MLCKDMQGVRARGPTDRGGGAFVKRSFGKLDCLTPKSVCFAEGFCSSTMKPTYVARLVPGCWLLEPGRLVRADGAARGVSASGPFSSG